MNKTLRTLLSLVLVASLSFAAVACGTGGSSDPTTTGGKSTDAADETSEPTEGDVGPSHDFEGTTLKIGSYYDMTPDPDANALAEAKFNSIERIRNEYNGDVEYVTIPGDYNAVYVTSVLSGDPIVDFGYILSYRLLPGFIEGGIAYPLDDLGVFDFDDYKWRPDFVEAGHYKGKHYSLLDKNPEIRYGIFWNKTLFEDYGLESLYDLYDNDEWTWDKFKELAIAGNQDIDNDGEIDIFGFNERENFAWNYIYSNGADIAQKTDDGMELTFDDPAVLEALNAYADFKQTVTHQAGWLGDWLAQINNFRDGNVMMMLEEFWVSYGQLGEMEDEFGFVPFPKGPSASDWSNYGKEVAPFFMLNGVENPKLKAEMFETYMSYTETEDEMAEMMEIQLESWSPDAKTVEIVTDIYESGLVRVNPIIGFSEVNTAVNDMFGSISSGEQTPQTALEANETAIQAVLDDLANKDYEQEMQDIADAAEAAATETEEGEGEEVDAEETEAEETDADE